MERRYGRVFFYVLIVCAVISVLPVVTLYTFVRSGIVKDYEEKVSELNMQQLLSSKKTSDQIFLETYNGATQIALSPDYQNINILMGRPFIRNYDDTARIKNVKNVIYGVTLNSSEIDRSYLYFPGHDRMLDGSYMQYMDYDKEQYLWMQSYEFNGTTIDIFKPQAIDGRSNEPIIFVIPISSFINGNNVIYIAEFNNHAFTQRVISDNASSKGIHYIFNQEGTMFFSSDTSQQYDVEVQSIFDDWDHRNGQFLTELGNKSYIFAAVPSDYFGFTYVYTNPIETMHETLNRHQGTLIASLIILILCSLFISVVIANKAYDPVRDIINRLVNAKALVNHKEKYRNELRMISNSIDRFTKEEKRVSGTLKRYEKELQKTHLFNAMMGNWSAEQEVKLLNYVFCMIISIDNVVDLNACFSYNEMFSIKAYLAQTAEHSFQGVAYCQGYIVQEDKIALVACSDEKLYDSNILEILSEVKKAADDKGVVTSFGIGRACTRVDDIHISYNEAIEANLHRIKEGRGSFILYNDIEGKTSKYYYPFDIQRKIFNAFLIEDNDMVCEEVDRFFTDINDKQTLSSSAIFSAVNQFILNSLTFLMNEKIELQEVSDNQANLLQTPSALITIEDYHSYARDIYRKAFSYVQERKNIKNIGSEIVNYIQKHYINSNLNVNEICDEYKISYSILRKILVDELGVNYSDYVNSLRVNLAKQLLRSSDETNNSIAHKVGYNNDLSFVRNFKKHEGITPAEYRRIVNHANP